MCLPARAQSLMKRIVLRRISGSMPVSGSSRISSSGIVHERLRQLHALAHALAVGADLLVGRVHQVDALERALRRGVRGLLVEAVQSHQRRHPLEAGHPIVEGVLLGTETDARVDARVAPDRLAEHVNAALARLELPGHQLHERRLAGAVGPEQPGDAGRNRRGDVVEAAHLSVPLGQMLGAHERGARAGRQLLPSRRESIDRVGWRDHVTISTPRTRRSRMKSEPPMSTMITTAAIAGASS